MRRNKKWIIAVVLAGVLLFGGLGGIVLAQEDGDDSQPRTLLDRVTQILVDDGVNITSEQLQNAFTRARSDMRTEALINKFQALVEQGRITQEQADAYLQWQQARPDVPFGFGFSGHGKFPGMRGMHGIRGWNAPTAPAQ
ncbi:MAG: hypothetical protein Q8Q07_08920 [Dehalococcoidales bacterium]|nr:hypothetical protein [Dehalococcoidales bacterium]